MIETIEVFVRDRNKYRSLQHQVLLTICVSVLFALNFGAIYASLGTAQRSYGGTAILLIILSGLLPFCIWFFISGIFYTFARSIGARAQFSIILRSVGYGMAAFIPAAGLWAIGTYLGLPTRNACNYPAFNCDPSKVIDLGAQTDALFSFYGAAMSSSIYQALFAVSLAFIAAGVYYWIIAMDESSTLTRQGASVVVGVPITGLVLGLAAVIVL